MRCKACDSIMTETEVIWRESIDDHGFVRTYKQFEELCMKCRRSVADSVNDFDSHNDPNNLIYADDLINLEYYDYDDDVPQ